MFAYNINGVELYHMAAFDKVKFITMMFYCHSEDENSPTVTTKL